MLSMFSKKKTVAGILAVFNKAADELQQLAEARMAEAADKNLKIRALMMEVEDAENEAQAAVEAAERISSLINGDEEAPL